MATISSLGTGSGLDLSGLLSNLMTAEQTPMLALQKQQTSYQARISSFGTLQGALSSLQSAANAMSTAVGDTASNKFSTPQATVGDTTIAYATAETTATAASYSLTVGTLAQAQRLVSPAYGVGSSASTAIGTGDLKIEFGKLSTTTTANDTFTADDAADSTPTVNRTKTITIDSTNNTLGGLRDAINASGADVTASIVNGSAGAQLVLTGKQTGTSSIMKLTMTPSVPASTPAFTGFDRDPVSGGSGTLSDTAAGGQVASDAAFTINGIAGSGTSNTITDMIGGVTLNLTKTTTSATTLTVSKDTTTKLTSALTTFVKAYNDAAGTMSSLGAYDATTKKAGALQGNGTLRGGEILLRFAGVGERQVHVVPAQQDVLADGQTREDQVAGLLGHGDQGEVGGAAADVADEDHVADLHVLPPVVPPRREPGVKGGLRFFQQRDVLEPRLAGGLDRQLAGHCVERGGDGQQDVLILKTVGGGLAGHRRIPGVAQVFEIGGRGVDRRDLLDVVGGRPRQDRRPAVDTGVRQPALGRADQPARNLRAVVAGEHADRPIRHRHPGQVQRLGRELLGAGEVQKRRQ